MVAMNIIGLAACLLISAPQDAAKPRLWAVVVGIDDYEDGRIADCVGSVRSARAVRNELVRAGWDGDQILLMTDGAARVHGPAQARADSLAPTRENLRFALTEWLPHRVRRGDLVLFYFAGQAASTRAHGAAEPRGALL